MPPTLTLGMSFLVLFPIDPAPLHKLWLRYTEGFGCPLSQIMLLPGPFLKQFPGAGSDQQPASVALRCQVVPQQ